MQGLLLIDKPAGISSFGVVAAIKRLTGEKRVGHAGTLDPMATGVLPVLIGRATRLTEYLMSETKAYRAQFRLGITTDTEDITGKVLSRSDISVSQEELEKVLEQFVGDISQVPPMYSALKKGGTRLYELARRGETVDIEPRNINISSIKCISALLDNEFEIEVFCSKGTYIRSLGRDIGAMLGTGATMTALRRINAGGFSIDSCVPLENLNKENISDYILNAEEAVGHFKEIFVSQKQAARFSNGGELDVLRVSCSEINDNEKYRVKYGAAFLGIGQIKNSSIKPCCLIEPYEIPINQKRPVAVCLGTFDGVHLGHMAVLENGLKCGIEPVVVTFPTPPGANSKDCLLSSDDKKTFLESLGFEKIVFLDYSSIRNMEPEEFLESLTARFNIKRICCGFNYGFGKNRAGSVETLAVFCEKHSIELSVSDSVLFEGEAISSTRIRQYIADGMPDKAAKLLGRPFSFSAEVVHGDERGRTIGYPTINQKYPEGLVVPAFGVYEVEVQIDKKCYRGIANIGHRPTFPTGTIGCETHIFDFSESVYGKNVAISLIRYIRGEKEFSGIEELKAQIQLDISKI